MSNVDDILLNNPNLAGPAQEKYAEREMRQKKQGAADNADGGAEQPRTLREKVIAARRAMDLKQRAKDKISEQKEKIGGYLKDRLLNLIPFYGPWKVFKSAVMGKIKEKIKLTDVIIMLFSNIWVILIAFGALAMIVMMVDFMTAGIWEQIKMLIGGLTKLGWGAIKAFFDLFAGLAK